MMFKRQRRRKWTRRITCKPPRAYKCFCISKRIVGTLFPRESYDNCMDSVETPKTVVLHLRGKIKEKSN